MITKTSLHSPVVFRVAEGTVVGRIGKQSGVPLDSIYPIVDVYTPHGTVIQTGIIHLHEPSAEDLERLQRMENILIESGDIPYNGVFKDL